MKFRVYPLVLAAASLGAILAGGCSRDRAAVAAAAPPLAVRTALVRRENGRETVAVPATLRTGDHAVIAARVTAVIGDLRWGLGQTVKVGDLLVRLEAPELVTQRARAHAQLAQAEREARRDRELLKSGAATPDAAEGSGERLRVAHAVLAEADAQLANTEIRAPFAGRIAQKFAYTGDLARAGAPLLVLQGPAQLQAEASVPTALALGLQLGQKLPVQPSQTSDRVEGRIVEIAAAADPGANTVSVILALPASSRMVPGQFVRVEVPGEAVARLVAPASAITTFGQMERVFVVRDGRAVLRLVRTGAGRGDDVELLSGAEADERLVLAPSNSLRDGQPVRLEP